MLCLFARRAGVFSAAMAVLMFAWPASNALLWLLPDQNLRVVGLSGPLYALWAALSALALAQKSLRWVACVSIAVLSFKLWAEQAWLTPVANSPVWRFPVVQAAHFTGALAAGVLTFTVGFFTWLLRPSPQPPPKAEKPLVPEDAAAGAASTVAAGSADVQPLPAALIPSEAGVSPSEASTATDSAANPAANPAAELAAAAAAQADMQPMPAAESAPPSASWSSRLRSSVRGLFRRNSAPAAPL